MCVKTIPTAAQNTEGVLNPVNQETHAARGFGTDSARVDSQVTFKIPEDQAEAVYDYLKNKYVGQNNIMRDLFPALQISGQKMSDVSIFTDEYFDTPNLDLYKNKNSTRHRTRENTTNPKDRKSGRELVQIKVTPPGHFELRAELKYKVKRSSKFKSEDDFHPLIQLINKKQREDFKNIFRNAEIDPQILRHIFTIIQTRSRVYINSGEENILSFSVDRGSADMMWAEGKFASVDVGLVETTYTEADEAKRKLLWNIREALIKDLLNHFPKLTINSDSKYSIVLDQLIKKIPAIPWLLHYNLI